VYFKRRPALSAVLSGPDWWDVNQRLLHGIDNVGVVLDQQHPDRLFCQRCISSRLTPLCVRCNRQQMTVLFNAAGWIASALMRKHALGIMST
jgi:hypothetical protein